MKWGADLRSSEDFAAKTRAALTGEFANALPSFSCSTALPLVAKYGTARLANQVRTLYATRDWPCNEEEWFMIYFLRASASDKSVDGAEFLERAMTDRERRRCYRSLLTRISSELWNPIIEKQAITMLNDSDGETAASAVYVLAAYSAPAVEPLLWRRLEQWSDKWRGRAAEIAPNPITGFGPNDGEQRLGTALFAAIASAKSWVMDENRRQRLFSLCIDDECGQQQSHPISGPIVVDASSGGSLYPSTFHVARYAARTFHDLKLKLQQFPPGTIFLWCPQGFNPFDAFTPGQRDEMFSELRAFLSQHSMNIEPYSEEKCFNRR